MGTSCSRTAASTRRRMARRRDSSSGAKSLGGSSSRRVTFKAKGNLEKVDIQGGWNCAMAPFIAPKKRELRLVPTSKDTSLRMGRSGQTREKWRTENLTEEVSMKFICKLSVTLLGLAL